MHVRNPIQPLCIVPQGGRGRVLARTALIVALLSSAPWIWMLQAQRAQADQLLADATARNARVARLMIQNTTGSKAFVEIQEVPYERP